MAIRGSNSTPGQRCIKWMLLVINFMFMITGVLLILVGTTISAIFGDFSDFIDSHFFSAPAMLVSVGIIMLGVSVFGCVGAIKHSTMLVNIYGCLMCLIFILEIAAAIAAFCLQGQIREMLVRTMRNSIENYHTSTSDGIDFMQKNLECCGIYNHRDWYELTEIKEKEVPMSCCVGYRVDSEGKCEIYPDGCLIRMDMLLSQSAMLIGTGAITVAFVEFLGILCAFMLAKTIRRNKTIRDARRWQLQQNLGITIPGKVIPPPGYTQMESSGVNLARNEPVTYTPNSPSVN